MAKKITRTSTKKTVSTDSSENSTTATRENLTAKKSNMRILFVVAAIVLLAYYFRDWFVVAMVNGRPIMRSQVINELEKQAGKQALDSLITKSLIQGEVQKRNINVTEKEVNDEIAKIEKQIKAQGQTLDEVLAAQGTTRNDVKEQTLIQLQLEKVLRDKIKVTKQEIDKAYKDEKDNFPKDLKEADIRTQIEDSLKSQKFSTEIQKFLDELRKKSSIKYIKVY